MTTAGASVAWAAVVGRALTVEVPASSANLGAGYDCLGLALDLVNHVTIEAVEGDGSIGSRSPGEGDGELPASRSNRFVAGLEAALEAAIGPRPGVDRLADRDGQRDPALARPRVVGRRDRRPAWSPGPSSPSGPAPRGPTTRRCSRSPRRIESHPDNAAAVLLGGFVVSAQLADRVAAIRFDAPAGPALRAVHPGPPAGDRGHARGCSPSRSRSATRSRTWAGSRSASRGSRPGGSSVLADLTVDRLHEPYRSVAYPELPRMTLAAREAGALGAFLSGAGSTILAFVGAGRRPVARRGGAARRGRRVRPLGADRRRRATQPRGAGRRGLTRRPATPSVDRLGHRRAVDGHAVGHRHRAALGLAEPVVLVQRHAGERRDQDQEP